MAKKKEPTEFTTTPAKAINILLKKSNVSADSIDFYEINEAFSVVAKVNMQLLNIPRGKINVHGGAVALGHPIGCSGNRIVVSLLNILELNNAHFGIAAVCNGGGGASAILIERIS